MNDSTKENQLNLELETMRHSFAHVLAQAVQRLYPEARFGIGPAIDDGFYYDFELPEKISPERLPEIEAEMKKIIAQDLPFRKLLIPRDIALNTLLQLGQTFKSELLQQIPDEEISFYKTGEEFIDLCRGPHVPTTSKLGVFKLINVQLTHWLGDESRPVMQRISGIGFKTKNDLQTHIEKQDELKKRKHTLLGKQLGLFSFNEKFGSGMPIWSPKGVIVKGQLKQYLASHLLNYGSSFIETPYLVQEQNYHRGEFHKFAKQDFMPLLKLNSDDFRLRKDLLVNHLLYFQSRKVSYKELPLKLSEFGQVFKNQNIDKLDGLILSNTYESDFTSIFTTPDQVINEIANAFTLITSMFKTFNFEDYRIQITYPFGNKQDLYLGDTSTWQQALFIIQQALNQTKLVAKPIEGTAKFYGPEIDFVIKDIFKRDWKIASVLVDLNYAQLYELKYINSNGNMETPIVLHLQLADSIDRLLALLVENYGGMFPTWLSPVQTVIIPISEKFNHYGYHVLTNMRKTGIRVEIDDRNETMQAKIRQAQLDKVPLMLIVGEKEERNNSVSVRPRDGQDLGLMRVDQIADLIRQEIDSRANNY